MKRNEGGFTLVELMVSVAVMVIVCVTSFTILIEAQNMAEDNRKRLLAVNAARSVLEAVKITPLTGVSAINTAAFVPAGLSGGAITIATNPANVAAAAVATVTVNVSWNGAKNRAQVLQVTTMRSKYQ